MTSSTHNQHLPNLYGGATSAPPPTPSAQPSSLLSTADAADTLSRLLHRLPPALSLPKRRATSQPTTCPPLISFSDQTNDDSANNIQDSVLTSSSQLGFFQLTNHSIPPQLANSAESEALALFDLPKEKKESYFPKNWPLGYEGEEDEDGDGLGESFCLDESCASESTELSLVSLRELTRALEKLGLRIVELLSGSIGFENPSGTDDPARFLTMTWISGDQPGKNNMMHSGGFYPYIVGLQYQIRSRKCSMLADSGWVSVLPQVDSVLVTIGDIAQVWSNGKLKKVRGRAVGSSGELGMNNNKSRCISMSVLVTLPLDSTVSPLLIPKRTTISGGHNESVTTLNDDEEEADQEEKKVFRSFSFEDYAWRVYHERLHLKDPLDRYRIIT